MLARSVFARAGSVLLAWTLAFGLSACAARPRMCGAPADCAPESGACVAGRCQAQGEGRVVVDEPETRRLLFAPVDVAYVRRGDAAGATLPRVARLGSARDGDAVLLLRFDVPLHDLSRVAEAYVLLARSDAVDVDPPSPANSAAGAIALHAARVVERWDGAAVGWARAPHIDEVRGPSSPVPLGRARVRVDVRELVRRWRRHDPLDQGIAIVAERTTTTGVAFALTPVQGDLTPMSLRPLTASAVRATSPAPFFAGSDSEGSSSPLDGLESGPVLEIYVK